MIEVLIGRTGGATGVVPGIQVVLSDGWRDADTQDKPGTNA
jgi:hypothetical protein